MDYRWSGCAQWCKEWKNQQHDHLRDARRRYGGASNYLVNPICDALVLSSLILYDLMTFMYYIKKNHDITLEAREQKMASKQDLMIIVISS